MPSAAASGGGLSANPAQRLGGHRVGGAVQDERRAVGALHGGADALCDEFVMSAAQDDGRYIVGGQLGGGGNGGVDGRLVTVFHCFGQSQHGTSVTGTPSAKSAMRPR